MQNTYLSWVVLDMILELSRYQENPNLFCRKMWLFVWDTAKSLVSTIDSNPITRSIVFFFRSREMKTMERSGWAHRKVRS